MYEGTYAPWENIPKYLKHHEIINPLEVLSYFFEINSATGHAGRFKEWRNYAVKSDHYINEWSGPGALLFTWEEHIRFIEAMYLVLHQYRNSWGFSPASEEQQAIEKETWDYFPANLTKEDLANPYLVIERFFKNASLAIYRDHLFEWLSMALTKIRHRDPDLDAEDVINVYENMLELYDAGWIIRQRYAKEPHLKKDSNTLRTVVKMTNWEENGNDTGKVTTNISEQTSPKSYFLRPLYPHPTPAEKFALQKIKEVILEYFKMVQLIAFLGSYNNPFTFFLLVLVSDGDKEDEGSISINIEHKLQHLSNIHVIAHKTASVLEAVKSGNRFWNNTLFRAHAIHGNPKSDLPVTQGVFGLHLAEDAKKQWAVWGKHGLELIHGAEFYMERDNLRLAAFTLHKATEAILKAIIQAVLGYRIQMHNIARLLRLTLLFTSELRQVFKLDEVEGTQLFNFLKEAYAQSHYRGDFKPDIATIKSLHQTVIKLHEKTDDIYRHFIAENER